MKTFSEFMAEGNPTARMLHKSKTQVTGHISADRGDDESANRTKRKSLEKDLKKHGIGHQKGVGEYKYSSGEGTGREVSYQTSKPDKMSKRRFGKVMRRLGRKHGQESVITKDSNKPAKLHYTDKGSKSTSDTIGHSKSGKHPEGYGETSGTKVRGSKLPKKTTKSAYHYEEFVEEGLRKRLAAGALAAAAAVGSGGAAKAGHHHGEVHVRHGSTPATATHHSVASAVDKALANKDSSGGKEFHSASHEKGKTGTTVHGKYEYSASGGSDNKKATEAPKPKRGEDSRKRGKHDPSRGSAPAVRSTTHSPERDRAQHGDRGNGNGHRSNGSGGDRGGGSTYRMSSYIPSFGDFMSEGEAWTRKEGQNKNGGLNAAGRASYERANPGSDLKAPSKKVGNPRRASFCARMKGMRKRQKDSNNTGEDRLSKSLRAWNC